MHEVLALSWDRRHLSGVEFSPGLAGPRITGGFKVEWPEHPPTATWLRETLKRHQIGSRQVTLALPREDAVLRLMELPNVPDDELPTLVRFQAAARSAQPIDQLLLDYLPLPSRGGVSQKELWLATTVQSSVAPIRSIVQEAGLELVRLTFSSFALAELVARGEAKLGMEPGGASLVVLRVAARMELAVVCQQQLIAAHAVNWSSVNEIPPPARMLAEVSRVLVQVQAWLPEGTLQRAWIIGDDTEVGDLPEAIRKRWNCPVERFDPRRDANLSISPSLLTGNPADYAIALGLVQIQTGGLTPKLDLLHPRQPPPKRDPRKPLYAAGAAAALLVAAIATGIVQQILSGYDREIGRLSSDQSKLNQQLRAGEPTFLASHEIEEWQTRNIDHLNQMTELHRIMNGTQRIVVSNYKFSPVAGIVRGKLELDCKARERADLEEFSQRLAQLPKFNVPPTPVVTTTDPEYSSRQKLEVDVVPEKKKTTLSTPATTDGPATKAGKSK